MPRPQRPPRERRGAPVDEATWLWLLDEDRAADDFELFMLDGLGDGPNSQLRKLWADLGRDVTATYANLYPGKRPRIWWRLQAPEMRRRLGGRGESESDRLAYVPCFEHGIPKRCLDDSSDAAVFESQAFYLRRLNLFLPGEARKLKPIDFKPEIIGHFDSASIQGHTRRNRGIRLETD